jgi:hypothetical protein
LRALLCASWVSVAVGARADTLVQRVSGAVFSKTIATSIKPYPAAQGPDGAIYVNGR